MSEVAERPVGQRSTIVLFALGLIWLAAYLWAAHASIGGAGGDEIIAVFDAALALPGVVAATMLAGATTGVTALGWMHARGAAVTGWLTSVTTLVSGLIIGGLAGGMILLGYGHRPSIMVLAWAVLAAGAIGGILGSARPRDMVAGGLAATVAAFLIGFVLNYEQDRLLDLFGAGTSVESRAHALGRLTPTESLLAGLAAGVVAHLYLRRARRVSQPDPQPVLWAQVGAQLVAGATPGIVLLLAEAVTRVGGGQLFGAAGSDSAIDQAAISYSGGSRLNHGLIVLFSGAFVALIAFGASMRPAARRTATGSPGAQPSARTAASRRPGAAAPTAPGPARTAARGATRSRDDRAAGDRRDRAAGDRRATATATAETSEATTDDEDAD